MRTLTQVELYNEDHDSASEEEIKQILVDTLELLGVSEDIDVETAQYAKKAVEKAQEYLKKYGSDAAVTRSRQCPAAVPEAHRRSGGRKHAAGTAGCGGYSPRVLYDAG